MLVSFPTIIKSFGHTTQNRKFSKVYCCFLLCFVMMVKSTIRFLTLLCFTKTFYTQGYKTMSNYSGIHSIVYVTVPQGIVGRTLATGLIENKLAACVNIIPKIESIYEWKGAINNDQEDLLMIKTRTDAVDDVTKYVKEKHPYEVCEVISVPIQNGNEQYFKFINDVVLPVEERTDKKKNS